MLISIGYGFDENHKLSRNFGPLNQDGGERRLNVLITRARERCVVFANFRGSDLAVEPGSASGISALATFLTYAADRSTPLGAGGEAPDDVAGLFGDTIARLLEDNGYHVAQNVGCAGFRIDIAIEDPNEPGVYLAGILCDGPYYWSSEVARDRDRLRVQVLEGLGWNLIRIWATEWYQHPASCTKTLLDAVEAAKSAPKSAPKKKPAPKVVSPVKTAAKKSSAKKTEEEPEASVPPAPSAAPVSLCLVPYTCCSECSLDSYHQFSSVPDSVLGTAIVQIVAVEGPISPSVLAARVKELGRVPRMTAAVKGRIAAVAATEVSEGRLAADAEGFLTVPVSLRVNDLPSGLLQTFPLPRSLLRPFRFWKNSSPLRVMISSDRRPLFSDSKQPLRLKNGLHQVLMRVLPMAVSFLKEISAKLPNESIPTLFSDIASQYILLLWGKSYV